MLKFWNLLDLRAHIPCLILCMTIWLNRGGVVVQNTDELLNVRALKISTFNVFQGILCGISKGTFDILHKESNTYNERCEFYSDVQI